LPTRPFAQIDEPAPLATEREVSRIARDRLLADRAFQVDLALTRHTSILVESRHESAKSKTMLQLGGVVSSAVCSCEGRGFLRFFVRTLVAD
jgi:hypothetical protein